MDGGQERREPGRAGGDGRSGAGEGPGESAGVVDLDGLSGWNRSWALAVVFGLASIPWTYAFVGVWEVPLWPAFVASATYYATDRGLEGFARGAASNLVGVGYGAATLAVVDGSLGGVLALSLVVGAFMFLASLHAFVPLLSFTPGAFFGYATLFSVDAAGATVLGVGGLPGVTLATVVSMALGAVIGLATDGASRRLV